MAWNTGCPFCFFCSSKLRANIISPSWLIKKLKPKNVENSRQFIEDIGGRHRSLRTTACITAPWSLTPKHSYTKTLTRTLGPPAAMVLWWDPAFLVRDDAAGVDTRPTLDHSAPLPRELKPRNSAHGKDSWEMRTTRLQQGSPRTGVWESPPFLLPPDLCVAWPSLWFQRLLPQCLQGNPTLYFSSFKVSFWYLPPNILTKLWESPRKMINTLSLLMLFCDGVS